MFAMYKQDNVSKYTKAKQFFSSYITHGVVSVVGIGLGALLMRYSPDETSKKAGLAACSVSGYSLFHSILRRKNTHNPTPQPKDSFDASQKVKLQNQAFELGVRAAVEEVAELQTQGLLPTGLGFQSCRGGKGANQVTGKLIQSIVEKQNPYTEALQ